MFKQAQEIDVFETHKARKLALVAAKLDVTSAEVQRAFCALQKLFGDSTVDFLVAEGMASLWCHRVVTSDATAGIPAKQLAELQRARLADIALYLAQKSALTEIDGLFAAYRIVYAVFKGVHVREVTYASSGLNPAYRLANDIDILVHPDQREVAAMTLIAAGYCVQINPDTISHEASFIKGAIVIDLHWDLLRPGRTRVPIIEE